MNAQVLVIIDCHASFDQGFMNNGCTNHCMWMDCMSQWLPFGFYRPNSSIENCNRMVENCKSNLPTCDLFLQISLGRDP